MIITTKIGQNIVQYLVDIPKFEVNIMLSSPGTMLNLKRWVQQHSQFKGISIMDYMHWFRYPQTGPLAQVSEP